MGGVIGTLPIYLFYNLTPKHTLNTMASAMISRDSNGVLEYVDLLSIRKDIKKKAAKTLEENFHDDNIVMNADLITEILIGKQIDERSSPKGARKALEDQKSLNSPEDLDYEIVVHGPDHFTAYIFSPKRVDLIFTRKGLTWKLTGISPRADEPKRKNQIV